MPSAGELLRTEREKRNRTLSDLAKETCISSRYLQAIEAEDTKTLPGDFFHRNFARQYATALGLPEEEIKRILDLIAPAPEIDPIPALSLPHKIAEAERQRKPLARVPAGTAATILILVLAGCSGLYALWSRLQESSVPTLPEIQETASEGGTEAASYTPAAPVEIAHEYADVPAAAESGRITVDLAATEKTWVSLSSEGRVVFSGTLDAEHSKNFALESDARLLTGNAAGLDVRMNGQPIGPIGQRGQVRVVLFTQDNYQILSPRKM